MNDQNESETENPLELNSPMTYEEAYYNDSEATALYDTYLMLRDYGFEPEELVPLMFAIEKLTIYDATSPEELKLRMMYETEVDG